MAPKQEMSKKNKRDKAARTVEDATFGLKNKNKSKKVQVFIDRVERGVKHSTGALDAEAAKEVRKANKLAKQLQEEELRVLFNEGIMNQHGKKKSTAAEKAAALGITEQSEEVAKLLEEFSSDSDEEERGVNEKRKTLYLSDDDDEPVEVFREKTIEDLIEEQRAKLHAEGKQGTPVTAESFAKWRADKLAKKQADAEARMKAEQTKKGKGKALSVLSGKELFNYDATLFVDDDAALNVDEENAMNLETKQDEAAEQARAEAEEARAREEQSRLMEAQRLELEARKYRHEERRRVAGLREAVFQLGAVFINEAVFVEEDDEDLEPFDGQSCLPSSLFCSGPFPLLLHSPCPPSPTHPPRARKTDYDSDEDDSDDDDDDDDDDEDDEGEEGEDGEEGGEQGGAATMET